MRPKFFDHLIVSLDTPELIQLWTNEFDVSVPGLQFAMSKAGNRYNDIRQQLGLARLYIFPRDERVMQRFVQHGLLQGER
jgi:hypothetical protein